MFVAGCHELEEQVRGVLFEREVADLVCDESARSGVASRALAEVDRAVPMRVGEAGDPVRCGRELHSVPVPGGDDLQCTRRMRLAGSGRAE